MNALAFIAQHVERHLGMAAGATGPRAVEAAVPRRMDATGTATAAAYLARLLSDRQELADLVDAVVVPETWFFRYPESFKHLAGWAVGRRKDVPAVRPLRVLSAPCCTGEEPFSIAATLLDAGLQPGAFRVEAVDVSRRLVEYARAAEYGASSFRETPPRPGRFAADRGHWAVAADVRGAVHFRVGNLADPGFLAGEPPFDAIFCRNLFIYLTADAKRTAVGTLDRLLAPGGLVYVGHAEPLGLMDGRFRSVGPPTAFAFGRADAPVAQMKSVRPSPSASEVPASGARRFANQETSLRSPEPRSRSGSDGPPPVPAPIDHLTAARAAADAGDHATAATHASAQIAAAPAADAYTLLGVAQVMAGDEPAAEASFTRALYLDPAHFDALLHMMALLDRRGDRPAADNYRRRAAKAGAPR